MTALCRLVAILRLSVCTDTLWVLNNRYLLWRKEWITLGDIYIYISYIYIWKFCWKWACQTCASSFLLLFLVCALRMIRCYLSSVVILTVWLNERKCLPPLFDSRIEQRWPNWGGHTLSNPATLLTALNPLWCVCSSVFSYMLKSLSMQSGRGNAILAWINLSVVQSLEKLLSSMKSQMLLEGSW